MPTQYLHRLRVEGAADALEGLRSDSKMWHAQPWRSMYELAIEEDLEAGSVTYRYEDDYKRPAPPVADLAAAYPTLTFSHEYTDEFAGVAVRQRYAGGACVEDVRIEPEDLQWVAWDYGE